MIEKRENMPGILFQSLARARNRAVQAELTRQGLGDLGQPMILFLLKERGRDGRVAAQRELADAMHVSPATIAVSLKSLERENYVEKLADATDQRRKGVRLTPKGEGAVHRCMRVFKQIDQTMFEDFGPEEIEQVCGYMMRMLRNLRKDISPEGTSCQC